MKISAAMALLSVASTALGGVVLHMPPPPAVPQIPQGASASAGSVSPLQRFAAGEPAKDRAGNVILQYLPPTVHAGGRSNWGGSGWGGYPYGWSGFGWGGFGYNSWVYPSIISPCCCPIETPCEII